MIEKEIEADNEEFKRELEQAGKAASAELGRAARPRR